VTVRRVDRGVSRSGRTRRVAVTVLGGLVLLAGVAMIALPGPGALVIVAGLAVLATEYEWARRWLDRAKGGAQASAERGAASRLSVAVTLLGAALLIAVAGVCLADVDTGVTLVDRYTSRVAGAVLLLSGMVVVALTLWQRRRLVAAGRRGEGPLADG